MQPDDEPTADVEIVASATADELRCHSEPEVRVSPHVPMGRRAGVKALVRGGLAAAVAFLAL